MPLVPPPVSDSVADWQATYIRYASCLKHLEELSWSVAGLKLNLDKGGLLLPIGAPLPTPEVRALFPQQFEFRQDGMRIAGSPVGTDSFMNNFVNGKVVEAVAKLNTIKLVGKKSPRVAHRLITACVTKLMGFLAATVPPHIACPALTHFDQQVESTFFDIISPTGTTCSQERMYRARLKAALPALRMRSF